VGPPPVEQLPVVVVGQMSVVAVVAVEQIHQQLHQGDRSVAVAALPGPPEVAVPVALPAGPPPEVAVAVAEVAALADQAKQPLKKWHVAVVEVEVEALTPYPPHYRSRNS
jgi:hypothetical protein